MHGVPVALKRGPVEGRVVLDVPGIDIRPEFQEVLKGLTSCRRPGSEVEGRPSENAPRLNFGAVFEQELGHGGVSKLGGEM